MAGWFQCFWACGKVEHHEETKLLTLRWLGNRERGKETETEREKGEGVEEGKEGEGGRRGQGPTISFKSPPLMT
jgi:hypothetical protein